MMKVTRYTQSCVLIETKGKKILVDPGCINYDNSLLSDWSEADVILVTHKHGDHCHEEAVKEIVSRKPNIKLYSSSEVAEFYPSLPFERFKVGDVIESEGIKIEVVKAVHGYMPFLKGNKEVHENIGFIVDDNEKRVYFTSDTISFKNDYKCDIIFVPVCNHGLVMGPFEAALFAKETGASLVIPYHYDNPRFPVDFGNVRKEFEKAGLNYEFLDVGEVVDV